jgi:hypothetical protein
MSTIPVLSGVLLGKGVDVGAHKVLATALEESPRESLVPNGGQTIEFNMQAVTNSEELIRKLNLDIAASFPIMGVTIAPTVRYAASTSINRFYTYLLVTNVVHDQELVLSKPRLTQQALEILMTQGWAGFAKRYGLEYVAGYVTGGSFFGLIEVATTTTEEQAEVKAVLGLTFGGTIKVDASVESVITSKISAKVSTVTVYQTGGVGDPIETDAEGMMQQARTFAALARSNPVPFQIIVHRYEDTVENLPLTQPNTESPIYLKRRDALEELGEKYQYYKDQRSDIDFVLRNLLSFDVYREQSVEELQATRQALQADFAGCSHQINEIERAARACLESPGTFDLPIEYFQPKVMLPNLGGEFMSV